MCLQRMPNTCSVAYIMEQVSSTDSPDFQITNKDEGLQAPVALLLDYCWLLKG